MVGNKQDLVDLRENDNKKIEEFIVKHNIDNYIEVSAKQNLNIEQLFTNIVSKIHNKRKKTNENKINEEPILPPSLIDKSKLLQNKVKLQNKCCIIL